MSQIRLTFCKKSLYPFPTKICLNVPQFGTNPMGWQHWFDCSLSMGLRLGMARGGADRTAAIMTTSCGLFRNEPYFRHIYNKRKSAWMCIVHLSFQLHSHVSAIFICHRKKCLSNFHMKVRALSLHVCQIIRGGTFGFRRRGVGSHSLWRCLRN